MYIAKAGMVTARWRYVQSEGGTTEIRIPWAVTAALCHNWLGPSSALARRNSPTPELSMESHPDRSCGIVCTTKLLRASSAFLTLSIMRGTGVRLRPIEGH